MLQELVVERYHKSIEECSNEELYIALLNLVKEKAKERVHQEEKKKLYYISAEFLIGKLLSNNLINLGLYAEIAKELKEHGKAMGDIEEIEVEPSLGNGGLGRLAACFLDSIATLGLNGDGIGLNYHLGLFKQEFQNKCQKEIPNPWIDDKSWLTKKKDHFDIEFGDFTVTSTLYDIAVTGYENRTNALHLFDIATVDESIVAEGIDFDKAEVVKNLTLFLYPDDSDEAGRLLRVYQQYFMVSNAAQFILKECKEKGCVLTDLHDYAAVQINDTHPTMIIPELIRLLTKEGVSMDDAIATVTKTCAYTNHTILAEALEKWPMSFIEKVAPAIVPIIKELDRRVRETYTDSSVYIIDKQNRVHMAHIDMHYGHSINGVAYLHTEILKNNELHNFYQIYPEKFNNKTNGITFRRWLLHCNKELTAFIEELIGDSFKKDAGELHKLLAYKDNEEVLDKLLAVKQQKKEQLAQYLVEAQQLTIDPTSIFDIQVKRLHEYKRQQLNAIYAIHKYLSIKAGERPKRPITMIFGAKAAPAYITAKDIIHLILCLEEVINSDPDVNPYLKVIMVPNYNVTLAEKLFPACDISEQISLASKEASGTGNMKFMLNGAVTLGTSDGANVEIHDLVGDENIYIFGESSEQVIDRYDRGDYSALDYYIEDKTIKEALDFIISDQMLSVGNPVILKRLLKELLKKDWFMTFPDCEAYFEAKERAFSDYEDRHAWARKMLVNIANAGFFSSDRTIAEYNREIWNLTN